MSELGPTVEELVRLMKARGRRLPSEIGAFIALECAEQLADGPALVTMSAIRISEEGLVSVFAQPGSASAEGCAESIVAMLAGLLVASGTAVPRALIQVIESEEPRGENALGGLRDHLEAALVPLNRQASRRVLARVVREARRPASERPPALEGEGIDDALDSLLGGAEEPAVPAAPTPALPPAAASRPTSLEDEPPSAAKHPGATEDGDPLRSDAEPVTTEHRMPAPIARRAEPIEAAPIAPLAPHASGAPRREARPGSDAPPPLEGATPKTVRDLDLEDEPAPSRGGRWLALAAVLALAGIGALGVAVLRPDWVEPLLGPARVDPPVVAPPTAPAPEVGTLRVSSDPPRAQVFLFVGRAPVVVRDLPLGVAHEFLVVAEGRRPERALVSPDAAYEATADGPRFELPVVAGASFQDAERLETVALGPALTPADPGAPGELGSVRVITSPPGAKVYMLVGFTPSVEIENQPIAEAAELLIWLEGHRLERLVVGPSDWREEAGGRIATIDASLSPLEARRR